MNDSFIYKKEWLDSLRALPAQVKGEVNAAIIEYGIAEELIPLKATARAVFALIKADMDRDRAASEEMRRLAQKRWERNGCNAGEQTEDAPSRICVRNATAYATAYAKESPPSSPLEEKSPTPPKEDIPPITPQESPLSQRVREKTAAERGKGAKAAAAGKRFTPPTAEEVAQYCRERNNGIDPDCFVDFYTANGWMQNRGKPIKDWKAAVRTWEQRRKTTDAYGTYTQQQTAAGANACAAAGRDGAREAERQRRLQGYAAVAMRFAGGKDAEAVADEGDALGDVPREPPG